MDLSYFKTLSKQVESVLESILIKLGGTHLFKGLHMAIWVE